MSSSDLLSLLPDNVEASARMTKSKSCSVSVLSWEQVSRLNEVLTDVVPVHGRGNFPTLEVRLKDIVAWVRSRLELSGIRVKDIRLNGSTASHALVASCLYQITSTACYLAALQLPAGWRSGPRTVTSASSAGHAQGRGGVT
uniref:Terminal nucleotidyltransferase 5C n=1 Tax=Cynoglossus semilaevis TaxID=244447 RepID=A0A3P8V3D2_CYNSE